MTGHGVLEVIDVSKSVVLEKYRISGEIRYFYGKSTARGYNAPCFVGMVHFLRLSINTRGTMGTERTKESIYAGFA